MRIEITYEWDYETIDPESGDILEHNFSDRLDYDAATLEENGRLGLVRNEGNEEEGLTERYWAYVIDGKLPGYFEDASGNDIGIRVPVKYHEELARFLNPKK